MKTGHSLPFWGSILVIVSFTSSFAATVYVDGLISTTTANTYNPTSRSLNSGSNTVYKTIAQANAAAAPGTEILVRAGTYFDPISPAASGSATTPITYKNFPNESVFLTAPTAIVLSSRNYILIDGFHAEDTRWLEANNSHYNVVQKCVFKRTPATGTTGNVRFVKSNFNRVLNNHIESGQDNLLFIDSNNNLAEGNTIIEAKHSIFGIRCGDANVIRGNFFSNTQQKIGEVYDCGVDTTAVANSFDSTSRNIIEENIFAGAVKYYSSSGGNGIQYAGQKGIIRNNVFINCNIGLSMAYYGDESLYNYENRVYNNTFYNNAGAGISSTSGSQFNIFKNNILAGNQGAIPDCFGVSPGQLIYRTNPGQSASFVANNFFYTAPGQPVIEEEFNAGYTLAQATPIFPGVFSGSFEVDPQFTDAPRTNLTLKSTSPLIDKGQFLTTTRTSGSGSTVAVADASYFSDGSGWPGSGDIVKLQGQTNTARVVALDLANDTVTLDRALAWNAAQGLALDYSGASPDLGAYETTSSTTPPPPPPPPQGDTTPPTVAIQSPASGSIVSGAIAIAATAADAVGVTGVQFFVNGIALGAEDLSAPYQTAWDTTSTANATYHLTAAARDAAGNNSTSAPASVTVRNKKKGPPR